MIKTLLIEDSQTFRTTFRNALMRSFPDMIIEEAFDGHEAMSVLRKFQPNLVFMDIRMPGESGLELTEKIKAYSRDIVVIILTDYDLPEYRQAAHQVGADDFIAKGTMNMSGIVQSIQRLSGEAESDVI